MTESSRRERDSSVTRKTIKMAFDWMKMRLDLDEDPAVIAMAGRLDLDEIDVVGRLWKLWAWVNRQLRDGNAQGVTKSWIDRYVRTPGFADALEAVGWLHVSTEGIVIPNYDRWNSATAKARASGEKRQARYREKSRSGDGECNARTVTQASTTPSQKPSLEKSREEKRREEGTDHIRTSWKNKDYQLQIRSVAAENFRGEPFLGPHEYREEDRRDLLAVAAIHHSGQVRPAWFLGALDAIRNRTDPKPVTAPVRLLKRILADKWPAEAEKRFGAFHKLVYAIGQEIPAEMLTVTRRPAETAAT